MGCFFYLEKNMNQEQTAYNLTKVYENPSEAGNFIRWAGILKPFGLTVRYDNQGETELAQSPHARPEQNGQIILEREFQVLDDIQDFLVTLRQEHQGPLRPEDLIELETMMRASHFFQMLEAVPHKNNPYRHTLDVLSYVYFHGEPGLEFAAILHDIAKAIIIATNPKDTLQDHAYGSSIFVKTYLRSREFPEEIVVDVSEILRLHHLAELVDMGRMSVDEARQLLGGLSEIGLMWFALLSMADVTSVVGYEQFIQANLLSLVKIAMSKDEPVEVSIENLVEVLKFNLGRGRIGIEEIKVLLGWMERALQRKKMQLEELGGDYSEKLQYITAYLGLYYQALLSFINNAELHSSDLQPKTV